MAKGKTEQKEVMVVVDEKAFWSNIETLSDSKWTVTAECPHCGKEFEVTSEIPIIQEELKLLLAERQRGFKAGRLAVSCPHCSAQCRLDAADIVILEVTIERGDVRASFSRRGEQ